MVPFEYKTSFQIASAVYDHIYGDIYYFPPGIYTIEDAPKILKPHRQTLLHDYISYVHEYNIDEIIHSCGYEDVLPEAIEVLEFHEIPLRDKSDFIISEEYYAYVIDEYKKLTLAVTNEVFTILFNDRRLMREYNLKLAEDIRQLKRCDYPDLLEEDGVVKRFPKIPRWLEKGLRYRDKERCQLCGADLSIPDKTIHFDHIVPLKNGGTNDPKNYQILCETCNTSKGARHDNTKNFIIPFWDDEK